MLWRFRRLNRGLNCFLRLCDAIGSANRGDEWPNRRSNSRDQVGRDSRLDRFGLAIRIRVKGRGYLWQNQRRRMHLDVIQYLRPVRRPDGTE